MNYSYYSICSLRAQSLDISPHEILSFRVSMQKFRWKTRIVHLINGYKPANCLVHWPSCNQPFPSWFLSLIYVDYLSHCTGSLILKESVNQIYTCQAWVWASEAFITDCCTWIRTKLVLIDDWHPYGQIHFYLPFPNFEYVSLLWSLSHISSITHILFCTFVFRLNGLPLKENLSQAQLQLLLPC